MVEPAPPCSISEQLDELRKKLNTLTAELEQNKAGVERDKARQSNLTSQISLFERISADLDKLRDSAKEQVTKAEQELTARKPQVLQELADDIERSLEQGFMTILDALTNQTNAVRTCEHELATRQADLLAKQQAVAERKAQLGAAQQSLQSIANEIKQHLAGLQKAVNDLRDAGGTGNAKKAFVAIQEIGYLKALISKLTSPEHERKLIEAFHTAQKALDTAEGEQKGQLALIRQAQEDLDAANKALEALRKSYAEQLKQLYTPQPAPAA